MKAQQSNYHFQKIVAATGVVLFIIKLTAWYLTNSVAILTDALEGIVNVISAFIGLYSLYLAAQPEDKNHPFGHGKVEFISAALEGVMISFAGIWIIFEAINHIINPQQIKQLDYGLILIAIAAAANFLIGFLAVKKGKKNNSMALIASGKHLISDTLTTLGVIIGIGIIMFTQLLWLDSVVALIFGVIIIFTGYNIIRKSISGIMDEADEKLLIEVIEVLDNNRSENWVDLHKLRILKYGSKLQINCHLTVPWYFTIKEAHVEVKKLETILLSNFDNQIEFQIHNDYCESFSCELCIKKNCTKREAAFKHVKKWNLNSVAQDEKHRL
ncbi:MAG: cation transporter [Flavobacteriales bacterium]|nr:cation transporter [Flavobacteriales bacterium]